MHVIHTVPAISSESSGPSYSVVRLCESLITRGEKVTLAAMDLAPMSSPPSFLKTFPVGVGPRRLGRSPAMRRWLYEQVQSKSVDLLHNHGMWQMNGVYPGWAARKGNLSLVVSPRGAFSEWAMAHGSAMKKVFWPALQRPALEHAACFHATADSEYEDIRRLGFRQPVAIIPNGIDIPALDAKTHNDSRTLLFLGRIHPKKGLDLLLPAWQQVQHRFPEWRMVIAGDDYGFFGASGYLNELQNLVQKLDLKRIEFVGELRGSEKTQAYHDAELFILPTYSENFGMTVAEALAAGTPAIVSKGAPWKGLQANGAGWWIDIGVDSLTEALSVALGEPPSVLAQRGLRGREWMIRDFSWDTIGDQMDQTYRWLLNGGATPAWIR
jgi:glycosyltransferase involved in cell wall biosynthesis